MRLGKTSETAKNHISNMSPSIKASSATSNRQNQISGSASFEMMESAIEDRIDQFKQRFRDGSAPARIRASFDKRKEEKKAKITAQRESASLEVVSSVNKIGGGLEDDTGRDVGVGSSYVSKLQTAPANWKPREAPSLEKRGDTSIHCADLKRGVCSVVSCEKGSCGCNGCDSVDFLEHCCQFTAAGVRVKRVGPRTPLRVPRISM